MIKTIYCGTIQDQIKKLDVNYDKMSLDELIEFNRKHEIVTISEKKLTKYTKEDFIYKFKQRLEMFKQSLRQKF